jgi:hypothetical protein
MRIVGVIMVVSGGLLLILLRRPIARFNIAVGNLFKGDEKYDDDDRHLVEVWQAILGLAVVVVSLYALAKAVT